MSEPRDLFGVFPYLKTSERIEYRGWIVRPADDTEDLAPEAAETWEALRNRFFIHDTAQVASPSYVHTTGIVGARSEHDFLGGLNELRVLLSYLYCVPRPETGHPFLSDEHATFYYIYADRVPQVVAEVHKGLVAKPWPDEPPVAHGEFYDGFAGSIDGRIPLLISCANRIMPSTPRMDVNLSQNISSDLRRWSSRGQNLFDEFSRRSQLSEFDERFLTALAWYNRSARSSHAGDLALVSLAIAFETLLALPPGEQVTARFKDAVTLLIGPIPRLDDWLVQFYNARSDIVHEGRSDRAMFIAGASSNSEDRGSPYRSLIAYGRTIFRICADTVLAGARRAEAVDIPSLFRTNHERFQQLCQILDEEESSSSDRLKRARPVIDAISRYQWIPESGLEIEQLIGAVKRASNVYLDMSPGEDPPVMDALVV